MVKVYSKLSDRQLNNYRKQIKPHLKDIAKLRGNGAGVMQIAEKLNISHSMLYDYIKLVPELEQAMDEGKALLITNLENALWNKALGGATIRKITTTTYKSTGEEVVRVEEEVGQPDNTAMIFALKSLVPTKYGDKQEIDIKVGEVVPSFKDILLGKVDEKKPK